MTASDADLTAALERLAASDHGAALSWDLDPATTAALTARGWATNESFVVAITEAGRWQLDAAAGVVAGPATAELRAVPTGYGLHH